VDLLKIETKHLPDITFERRFRLTCMILYIQRAAMPLTLKIVGMLQDSSMSARAFKKPRDKPSDAGHWFGSISFSG
jgi:hypothetical protein